MQDNGYDAVCSEVRLLCGMLEKPPEKENGKSPTPGFITVF